MIKVLCFWFFSDLLGIVIDFLTVESDVVIEIVIDLNSPHGSTTNNNFY